MNPKRSRIKPKARPKHTAAEDAYLSGITALGCEACDIDEHPDTLAAVHHPRHDERGQNYGMGGRAPHKRGIPLCEGHHQGKVDTSKIAIHDDPLAFEARYGTEEELLARTHRRLLARLREESIIPPLQRAG